MAAWNKKVVQVEMCEKSFQYIHMKIKQEEGKDWFFTLVYASPNENRRKALWEDLKKIFVRMDGAWMVVGKFDDIASISEKKGGV